MLWVLYRAKGDKRSKRTFFSDHEEFTIWIMQQYKNIEIKNMNYGG